mgnify:FL=1
MKIKQGFVMRDVAGQAVAIATGEASKSFHGMVKLNDTGAVIWNGIEKGLDEAEIAEQLAASYDVEVSQALKDVESFIARMRDAGLVEG